MDERPASYSLELRPAARGRTRLGEFVAGKLARYSERNEPMADATSGLSPHLHFGHIGAHEVLEAVLRAEDWDASTPTPLGPPGSASARSSESCAA